MKVLIVLALAAVSAAGPAPRGKRSFGLQYPANSPAYSLQSNSQHSSSYQTNSQQSTSLKALVQPYQQYQHYQPLYNVQPYQQVYNQQVYPVRQQAVYSPVRTYTPVQAYAQTYTPVQSYSTPTYYQGQAYGNGWAADPWC